MKLSWKCRSGRDRERVVFQRPSGRGGKTPHTFSDDERVAAKYDGDVVVPSLKSAAFIVVEAEPALQILVGAFGSPALHDEPHEPPSRPALWQRNEEAIG